MYQSKVKQSKLSALSVALILFAGSVAMAGDVSVALTNGVEEMSPGGTFIYTLTVVNNSSSSASNVSPVLNIPLFVDQISVSNSGTLSHPTSTTTRVTWPSFTLAGNATVLRQVNVALGDLPAGTSKNITNTATVSSTGDTVAANNTANYPNTLVASPNLNVAVTDGLTDIWAGATMINTVTLGNQGSIGASGVVLKASIPANTTVVSGSINNGGSVQSGFVVWNVGAFAAGQVKDYQFTLKLANTLPANASSTLTVTATVTDDGANGADSCPSNNTACDVDCVHNTSSSNFDLGIKITDGLDTINPGATMVYTMTITNHGNGTANNVLVKANIPANTTVVSGSISNSGSVQSGFVVYPTFTLASQASVTRKFTLKFSDNPSTPVPEFLTVTATVSGDAGEHNLSNNCDSDCDRIVIPPTKIDLSISQCNGICDCVPAGYTVNYTLTICNLCGPTATGVLVKDTIPPGTDFVSASDGGTYNSTTGIITWPTFSLAAGDCVYRSFKVKVKNPVPNGITELVNYATVTDDGTHGADKCDTNNKTCLITPICTPQNPDVCITKRVDFPCVTLGTEFTYTLTVSTLNSVGITGGLVRDTIPANTTFVSASNGGTFAGGVVTFPLFDLAGNSSVSGTITVRLNNTVPPGVTTISNLITVTDDGTHGVDSNLTNNSYTLVTPICTPQHPDLCITKKVDLNPPCVTANALMTYTLTISSLNSVATTGVLVTDIIPANTTFVSASNGGVFTAGTVLFPTFSLAGNASVTRTVVVRAAATIPAGVTTFVNVCTVEDDHTHGPDINTANNTYTLTTPVCTQNPDLAITKTIALDPPCVIANALMTYTLTISSLNSVATTGVLVTDTIPANTTFVSASNGGTFAGGVVTFPTFSLAGNASVTRTVVLRAAATIPAGVTTFVNICTVDDDHTHGPDLNTTNNSFTLTTPVCGNNPDLAITKTIALDPPCVIANALMTYTLTISSLNSVATTGVLVTDTIPANTTFVSASNGGTFAGGVVTFPTFSLAGNTSVTRTVVLRAAATIPAGVTTFVNICTVDDDHTHGPDLNTTNNSFTLTTPVCQTNPDLMITKAVDVQCVVPGATLTYTLTISSLNSVATTGVMVRDIIPANTTFVSASDGGTFAAGVVTFPLFALAANASTTRTVVLQVAATLPANVTSLINVATVIDDGTHGLDVNPANNTFTLDTPLCTQQNPDLMITKSIDPPCVTLGANLTYTLTISSLNSVATTGVLVRDTIPANTTFVSASDGGTFAAGVVTFPTFALAGNATVTRTVVLTAAATVPPGVTSIINITTVTDDTTHGPDTNPTNNTFTLETPICTTAGPDLALDQQSQQICADPSQQLTNVVYTLRISEAAGMALTGVVATDTIPPNATFLSASDGGTFANGVVTFPAFDIPAGTTVLRTVTVQVANPIVALVISLTNQARVDAPPVNGVDINPANNTATITDRLRRLRFLSEIAASRLPIVSGVPLSFSASAIDDAFPDRNITYTWNFGDGTSTTTTATSVPHTYAVSGSYLVTVTADDGVGCPLVAQLQTQQPPPDGGVAECLLFRAPFNLRKANSDSLTLLAQVSLPQGFRTAGHKVTVAIAGFSITATLDSKGNGVNLPKNQKIKVKPNGNLSLVTLKVTKSNLRTLLAPGVPPNASTATVRDQLFVIGFDLDSPSNANSFGDMEDINYKSNGKTGIISF